LNYRHNVKVIAPISGPNADVDQFAFIISQSGPIKANFTL